MTAPSVAPLDVALFILAAFTLAGVCQTMWLASWAMPALGAPLDRGATLRGRRLLGDHKTLRGFVVMVPATGAAFALLHTVARASGAAGELWPYTTATYFAVGLAAGAGFMAGELPNSFVKRQLGIPPGAEASGPFSRRLFRVVDRIDSVTGALLVLTLLVGVPVETWIVLAIGGPLVHGLFSAATTMVGGKHGATTEAAK
jgi:CDP-2,3-bis-(O-geranylgeranyl)-sn-glycerol synthase